MHLRFQNLCNFEVDIDNGISTLSKYWMQFKLILSKKYTIIMRLCTSQIIK